MIDFGDPIQKARGPRIDPRAYIRAAVVEDAATRLLGMAPRAEVEEMQAKLDECEAERERLATIVAGGADLSEAEERLREALGPSPSAELQAAAIDQEDDPQ